MKLCILSLASIFTCICLSLICPISANYRQTARVSHNEQRELSGIKELLVRILKKSANRFTVVVKADNVLPRHNAEIVNVDVNNVRITGNSGVAVAWALHIYLTQYAGCHFSWTGNQIETLPDDHLPAVPEGRLALVSQDEFTAYPNVCTFGYSFLWWNFTDWEREIDWMALHGINLVYALNAQEYIFTNVYKQLGLSQEGLDNFFSGPAFLPWNRMGNLKVWGGPLPWAYLSDQLELQRQILKRMNDLGIYPVLQGFSGIVPDEIITKFPGTKYSRLSNWVGFGSKYSEMVLLEPTDKLFGTIAQKIIQETQTVFGKDSSHFYAMDTFNEVTPVSGDLGYLRNISLAIFTGMKQADNLGIWVSQAWFLHNTNFWSQNRTKAYLDVIPKTHLILLDLDAEAQRFFERFDGYYNHSFTWQTLINFGGNNNMFGGLTQIMNPGVFPSRKKYPNLIGTGIAPEGRGQNDVVFELALESTWRTESIDTDVWVQSYSVRRYGAENSHMQLAWKLLGQSVHDEASYSAPDWPLLTQRPSLGLSENVYYNTTVVEIAWHYFLESTSDSVLRKNPLFKHDLVDLSRQVIQIRIVQYYYHLVKYYHANNIDMVFKTGNVIISLLDMMDTLLGTDEIFMLQPKINKMRFQGNSTGVSDWLEFNLRNQLTSWGPGPDSITDYASKMWNGLIKNYYLPRWVLFVEQITAAMSQRTTFDEYKFKQDVYYLVEKPFYENTDSTGPATPKGDPIEMAVAVSKSIPNPPSYS